MCINKRVLIALGVVALGIFAVSPRLFGAVAPFLIVAACPLSMVFAMRTMNANRSSGCGTHQHGEKAVGGDHAVGPGAAGDNGRDARLRELESEVDRLKAELRLRDQRPSA